MSKKVKHLWDAITTYENLAQAFRKLRLGKRFHRAITRLYYNLDDVLFAIQRQLLERTWRPGPFREFVVHETKPRLIQAPAAIDRIVHWPLMLHAARAKGRMTVDEVRSRVASFLGYTKHCKAHETVENILAEVMFQRREEAA